jgi:hypothetical protein
VIKEQDLRLKHAALTVDEKEVVSGSDDGVVHVFGRKKSVMMDTLRIAREGKWVQTVTVSVLYSMNPSLMTVQTMEINKRSIIVTARSKKEGQNDLYIWEKVADKPVTAYAQQMGGTFKPLLNGLLWILAGCFVLQNLPLLPLSDEHALPLPGFEEQRTSLLQVAGIIVYRFLRLLEGIVALARLVVY